MQQRGFSSYKVARSHREDSTLATSLFPQGKGELETETGTNCCRFEDSLLKDLTAPTKTGITLSSPKCYEPSGGERWKLHLNQPDNVKQF
ncbi:hypothetical protein J1605_004531 [Eschrichtius robustus]|uniref:Uncharacterized protein n=1 Tax=Eschrichtius robustus TaxID=9764 RepID=A0AB34HH75_ESCRO|nr:hypothetical protein J1605_004531 [Eschrichtius robustus]